MLARALCAPFVGRTLRRVYRDRIPCRLLSGARISTASPRILDRTVASIYWGIYESAYYANERGVLGEREWIRFAVGICRRRVALADFWDPGGGITPMSELLTPDFVDYIESNCE